MFVVGDELREARLVVRREQLYPSSRDGLMVKMTHAEMRSVSLNAFPNQRESFIERFSVEQKPGQPQMIAVTE